MRPGVSLLDFKLGLRMLLKYPGLTVVGGLAIAFAIWVGAGAFEMIRQVVYPTLPLPEGERIVGIHNWDAAANRADRQVAHDFFTWREELRTVEDLGAFRTTERNLIAGAGGGEPAEVAQISASAFRVTQARPQLGRVLVDEDEQPGATSVAVIGHELWQQRFNGDPAVVGREIRLGRTPYTVVGVMPQGFAFPISQSLWVPLQLDAAGYPRGSGPALRVFGRLASGASLEEAQAELSALGQRVSREHPATHQHLRPQVLPYAKSIINIPDLASLGLMGSNVFLVMLLVLVCGNVALLLFARAASREAELVVRSALGASRGRIVAQLFAEALVLAAVGAAVGLAGINYGLRWVEGTLLAELLNGARLPFWFRPALSTSTVAYALLLTLLAAAMAGLLPGLKVTRGLAARLRQASSGGGGFRFGGVWTAVIVSQIAITVAFPVTTFLVQRDREQVTAADVGFAEEQFLSARVQLDRADGAPDAAPEAEQAAWEARYAVAVRRLEERLLADPAVEGVTHAERLPRMYHPHRIIEVDEGPAAPLHPEWPNGYRVSSASVAPDYFEVLQAPIRLGRGFHSADVESGAPVVIVNRSLVRNVFGDQNPIGRRIRYVHLEEWDEPRPTDDQPWHEIIGVVDDLGMARPSGADPKNAGFYHPVAPGGVYPTYLALRLRGDPQAYAPQLRAHATATDPELRLSQIVPVTGLDEAELRFLDFWFWMTMGVSVVALLLALTGIYAVMSFTVAQRTREIGIRVALGANVRNIATGVFRRPLRQVGFGVLAGTALVTFLAYAVEGRAAPGTMLVVAAYSLFMLGVCLLACIVPTRRALRVEPTEALRAE